MFFLAFLNARKSLHVLSYLMIDGVSVLAKNMINSNFINYYKVLFNEEPCTSTTDFSILDNVIFFNCFGYVVNLIITDSTNIGLTFVPLVHEIKFVVFTIKSSNALGLHVLLVYFSNIVGTLLN